MIGLYLECMMIWVHGIRSWVIRSLNLFLFLLFHLFTYHRWYAAAAYHGIGWSFAVVPDRWLLPSLPHFAQNHSERRNNCPLQGINASYLILPDRATLSR